MAESEISNKVHPLSDAERALLEPTTLLGARVFATIDKLTAERDALRSRLAAYEAGADDLERELMGWEVEDD